MSDQTRAGVPAWVAAALSLALLASLISLALVWQAGRDDAEAQALVAAGEQAQLAARVAAEQMTTYDYRTAEEDFAWVETAGTEAFQQQFAEASAKSIQVIKALKASAKGTVVDSGVDVEDPTHVKVVLFVDQRITGDGEGPSEPDQSRITMHMVKQRGVWLVDSLDLQSYATR